MTRQRALEKTVLRERGIQAQEGQAPAVQQNGCLRHKKRLGPHRDIRGAGLEVLIRRDYRIRALEALAGDRPATVRTSSIPVAGRRGIRR